jgi:hypothetical protein
MTPINSGLPPFAGRFQPREALSALDGEDPNGVWKLEVRDRLTGDTGTLNSWSLALATGEPRQATDAAGRYAFYLPTPGPYAVRHAARPDVIQTGPTAGFYAGTLDEGRRAEGLDFDVVDVTGSMACTAGRTTYDRRTRDFAVPVTVRHVGAVQFANVKLVAVGLPPSVTLKGADGFTCDGCPYVNLTSLLLDACLDPGDCVTVRLAFCNPGLLKLNVQFRIEGEIALGPPVITSAAIASVSAARSDAVAPAETVQARPGVAPQTIPAPAAAPALVPATQAPSAAPAAPAAEEVDVLLAAAAMPVDAAQPAPAPMDDSRSVAPSQSLLHTAAHAARGRRLAATAAQRSASGSAVIAQSLAATV